MIDNHTREAIEKVWGSYRIRTRQSSATEELKAYFLEDTLTAPTVTYIEEYAEEKIIEEMISIDPQKVLAYLFKDENFKVRQGRFSRISYYLYQNAFEVYEAYPDKFFIAVESLRRSDEIFMILKKFYTNSPKVYEPLLLKHAEIFLESVASDWESKLHWDNEELFVSEAYYQLFKEHMDSQSFQKFQLHFLQTYLLNKRSSYYNDAGPIDLYFLNELKSLLEYDAFFNFLEEYLTVQAIGTKMSFYFYDLFQERTIELFEASVLRKKSIHWKERESFYKILKKLEFEATYDIFLDYTLTELNLATIHIASQAFLKYEDKLLTALKRKKGEDKLLVQMMLMASSTPSTIELMVTTFQQETNDKKVREPLLPMMARRIYAHQLSLDEVNGIIALAKARKKLAKWSEPFKEEDLPPLYLINGEVLTSDQIRFLFYRMSLVTQMESDVEANLLIHYIDKTRSNAFAKFILEGFLDNGAKAPQKYLMAMAGIFGDDTLLEYLKKIFNDVLEAKRMKMAQYVIGTLALIGTDKALRFIEYVGRKHKKKAALHDYCLLSLEIAAKELGITSDELSEKIMPDFGFDGLYKTIEVEGEEFRVFVAKDFKLQYINEENKIRKSLPKAASKEIKATLKTIQTEIRDVNKAGVGRLEQYMVKERRWDAEAWQTFYLFNPVMFIYASTLVWGIYDEANQLKALFYIDEDSAMLNIEEDEISLESGDKIGMVHPLRLSEAQKRAWQTHFYDLEIVQPFRQLDREVFTLTEEERAQNALTRFTNKTPERGSGAIKTLLEKRGYRKDVVDGGALEFYKDFPRFNIRVELGIYGINVVYDYDDFSEIGDTIFRPIDGDWRDRMVLKDIPDMVISEVILDLTMVMEK